MQSQGSILKARQPLPVVARGAFAKLMINSATVYGGSPLAMHALWYLADDPTAIERLRKVCSSLRIRIDSDAQLRSSYLIASSCKHLALSYAATNVPHALTPSIFFALTGKGADVPKYFVEQIVSENLKSGQTGQESVIPQDTIDHLVALGFKMYGDSMIIGGGDAGETVIDDLWTFQQIASGAIRDVESLKRIVYDHHFTPALVSPDHAFWSKFWIQMPSILQLDTQTGQYLLKHSGFSLEDATDKLLYESLCDPTSTASTISDLQKLGYTISKKTTLLVLTNPNPSNTPHLNNAIPTSINLLKWVLSEEMLLEYVQATLSTLLKTMPTESTPSQHQIDTLLRVFKSSLPDATIAKSILAAPPSQTSKQNRTLPFMTAFGQAHGGIADSMWQVICADYGPEHAFVAAFLVDVVIGGTIVDDKGKKKVYSRPGVPLTKLVKPTKSSGSLRPIASSITVTPPKDETIVVVAPDGVIRKKSLSIMTKRRESGVFANSPISPSSPGGVGMGNSGSGYGPTARARTFDSRFSSFRSSFSGSALPLAPVNVTVANFTGDLEAEEEEYDDSDDRERDVAARETIQAMVDGVHIPIDPGMLIPICRAVVILKSVRSRVVDFMTRAEKEILKAAYTINTASQSSETYNRLSKTKWISSLYRNVIDSQAWMEHVMTTSELTVLEGLKPSPDAATALKPKRRTGIHPPVPGIFESLDAFTVLLESAGDASVVDLDSGPVPSSVQAVARSVRMRRQKSISSAPPVRRTSHVPIPGGNVVGSGAAVNTVEYVAVRRFYKCCEELVSLLENAQRGEVEVPVGPFQKWLEEKDETAKSWNGWFRRSSLFNGSAGAAGLPEKN
ncbi:UNVERIFIED_CONTAM: hypothetical protein HDU68_008699 [Siphonaria sp. JEL0065]|nr:hypothetical protein HDU68_008699 [Siphonaria sp. JEL0065]